MKISIIQPILTSYRNPFFQELSQLGINTYIFADIGTSDFGEIKKQDYNYRQVKWIGKSLKFSSIKNIHEILNCSKTYIHVADFKYISLWILLFLSMFGVKKVWLHGQGGYKRKSLIHSFVYKLAVFLSDGYICYTEFSREELKKKLFKFQHKKISVVENTLYLDPIKKVSDRNTSGILFIGRLRERSNIELLIAAADKLELPLHIVGSGSQKYQEYLKSLSNNTIFHEQIYDTENIKQISHNCNVGVYPGDAGLSVVHYMALGLPVVIHNDIYKHMGPEPSYVKDGFNGVLFERDNLNSLIQAIKKAVSKDDTQSLSKNSLNTFKQLATPSMAKKIISILKRPIST